MVFIDAVINSIQNLSILAKNMRQSVYEMGLADFVYYQDNDPKQIWRLKRLYFEN